MQILFCVFRVTIQYAEDAGRFIVRAGSKCQLSVSQYYKNSYFCGRNDFIRYVTFDEIYGCRGVSAVVGSRAGARYRIQRGGSLRRGFGRGLPDRIFA